MLSFAFHIIIIIVITIRYCEKCCFYCILALRSHSGQRRSQVTTRRLSQPSVLHYKWYKGYGGHRSQSSAASMVSDDVKIRGTVLHEIKPGRKATEAARQAFGMDSLSDRKAQ